MAEFKIFSSQVDLIKKTANVAMMEEGTSAMIHLNNVPYDQPGEQTETELKALMLNAAKALLQRAVDGQILEQ